MAGDWAYVLEGYCATWKPYLKGGVAKQVARHAFDAALAQRPDVRLLVEHRGEPLARTTAGTLELSADEHGLRVWARLELSDPDVRALVLGGGLNEMSHWFSPTKVGYDAGRDLIVVEEAEMHGREVSLARYGANPDTRAHISKAPILSDDEFYRSWYESARSVESGLRYMAQVAAS